MKSTLPIWLALLLPTAFVFSCYSQMEAYCFFYPSIDTQYAPGFSEPGFSQVSTGMTAQTVQQKLGAPLHTYKASDGTEWWSYTSDGKCKWGDWAWLGRQIIFRDGMVIEVVKRVYYD